MSSQEPVAKYSYANEEAWLSSPNGKFSLNFRMYTSVWIEKKDVARKIIIFSLFFEM